MLKLHEIQHPINDRTYPGCVAHTGSKVNAGGKEVVSNGRMSKMSMKDYAAHEGMKEINQNLFLLSDVWLFKFLQSKASAVFWLHVCKSPLFESHSFPCGCLATPLQHNIVRINRVKRDRCLLKTTSQGCSPIMAAALSTAAISASDLIQLSLNSTQKTSWKVNMGGTELSEPDVNAAGGSCTVRFTLERRHLIY